MSRMLPAGFIPPCLPTKAPTPPSGGLWVHEIKHDGFVRLYRRSGNDLDRPLHADCGGAGSPALAVVHPRRRGGVLRRCRQAELRPHPLPTARRQRVLYAFDLIELNGDDLRREPLEVRKATLASVLAKAAARPSAE